MDFIGYRDSSECCFLSFNSQRYFIVGDCCKVFLTSWHAVLNCFHRFSQFQNIQTSYSTQRLDTKLTKKPLGINICTTLHLILIPIQRTDCAWTNTSQGNCTSQAQLFKIWLHKWQYPLSLVYRLVSLNVLTIKFGPNPDLSTGVSWRKISIRCLKETKRILEVISWLTAAIRFDKHFNVTCSGTFLPWLLSSPHLWVPYMGVAEGHPWVHPSPYVCLPLQVAVMAIPGLALPLGGPTTSSGTGSISSSCWLPCLQAGITLVWVKGWMVCCILDIL